MQATGAALKAAEQGKAHMEKVMRSVQSTLLPTAEPATDASKTGTLKPKIQAPPAPAPPTLAQKSAAAQQKVRDALCWQHPVKAALKAFRVYRYAALLRSPLHWMLCFGTRLAVASRADPQSLAWLMLVQLRACRQQMLGSAGGHREQEACEAGVRGHQGSWREAGRS